MPTVNTFRAPRRSISAAAGRLANIFAAANPPPIRPCQMHSNVKLPMRSDWNSQFVANSAGLNTYELRSSEAHCGDELRLRNDVPGVQILTYSGSHRFGHLCTGLMQALCHTHHHWHNNPN